jgi:hypothetical protein
MVEHLRKSEVEINELLAEYWKLRHETGRHHVVLKSVDTETLSRCVYGNPRQQVEHASFIGLVKLLSLS